LVAVQEPVGPGLQVLLRLKASPSLSEMQLEQAAVAVGERVVQSLVVVATRAL
jgi:hypothetical protein